MFNVGDQIRIKENANQINSDYMMFANEMREFLGNVYKIVAVERRHGVVFYKLQDVRSEDGLINGDGYWLWDKEWFEPADDWELEENDLIKIL